MVGGGSGVFGLGGQGGCERRIEVFVKIQKKEWGEGLGGGRVGSGWGGQGRCNREQRIQKNVCVGGGEGSGWRWLGWM